MRTILFFSALVSIFLVFSPPPARGEEVFPYAFSISGSTGFVYGQGEEIVYKYPDQDVLLSELLWDLKPVFYLGTSLEFARAGALEGPGFLAELSFKFGIPAEAGIMEDRDWQSPTGVFLTNYSRHDARSDALFSAGFRGGFSTPLLSRFVFKAYLGVSYTRIKWTSLDGYLQYASAVSGVYDNAVNEATNKIYLSGEGIVYSQEWLMVFPGLSLGTGLGKKFWLEIGCDLSPFVYGIAVDDHLLRGLRFTDNLAAGALGGFFWEPRGSLRYTFNRHTALAFQAAFRSVKGQRGESYWENVSSPGGPVYRTISGSGGGYYFLDLGISFKVTL